MNSLPRRAVWCHQCGTWWPPAKRGPGPRAHGHAPRTPIAKARRDEARRHKLTQQEAP